MTRKLNTFKKSSLKNKRRRKKMLKKLGYESGMIKNVLSGDYAKVFNTPYSDVDLTKVDRGAIFIDGQGDSQLMKDIVENARKNRREDDIQIIY